MTNASSSKNRALFLAVLMAVSIPSAAFSEGLPNEMPDEVLTVSVNMGSNDAGDSSSSSGCTGFSSMAMSTNQLQSRVERVTPGVETPTIQQRLAALRTPSLVGMGLSFNDTVTFYDGQADVTVPALTQSAGVGTPWNVHPMWIEQHRGGDNNIAYSEWFEAREVLSELTQQDLSGFDENHPLWSDDAALADALSFSAETPSLAMIDQRTYITSPFTMSFDASNCESDSQTKARVMVLRDELKVGSIQNNLSTWSPVETSWDSFNSLAPLLSQASEGGFRGDSRLLHYFTRDQEARVTRKALMPFGNNGPGWDGSPYFDESEAGEFTLRAATYLFGDLSQNAQIKTQFMFWMEVSPTGEFDENW